MGQNLTLSFLQRQSYMSARSQTHSRPIYRGKATRYPLYWRVGGSQGPWTNAKNFASTGFRTSDLPAHNELWVVFYMEL